MGWNGCLIFLLEATWINLLLAMVLFVDVDIDNGNGGLPDRVILLVLVVV